MHSPSGRSRGGVRAATMRTGKNTWSSGMSMTSRRWIAQRKLCAVGRYAPEAKVSFLSSLVSSPSSAQTAAKDLWPTGLLPQAEEEIQSALADGEPELLSRGLCAAKGKVRNALRLQAALPPATSRLRAAQRGFRPKMAPAAEIGTCKFHKQRSARNYRIRKDFPPHS